MADNVHEEVMSFLDGASKQSNPDDEFDALLDNFIAKQMQDAQDNMAEVEELSAANKRELTASPEDEYVDGLFPEEKQLYTAYISFISAVAAGAASAGVAMPELSFTAQDIYPRFRPNRIRRLQDDIVNNWKTLLASQPVRLSSLPKNPSDEQILNFAEKTTDENLQGALISYVEVLIELDGCEIAYNLRKAKSEKRKIERKIIDELNQRKERMQRYKELIEKERFPIDAERLVSNFFKTVRKDPDGAQKILESNPATFAPIQIENIKPRFFGMIKPKPEDGIRINKEIGKFFKNVKK